ncbi:CLUMA_CG008276, isoform A [Clunio marinus]|uniref:CLUMA_CG008276, isoform A n=1 Tax=Clunio marinus TaxID=568069 RepID=A0A1J1I757_9DIPT|nr:CLUMA_CG008276, isoform A [Clunio marinus]
MKQLFNMVSAALKEFIISAGALNSPKLLVQSRIVKKVDLESHGINFIHHHHHQIKDRPI